MLYSKDSFYVDSEYGYFIIFGNKVFNLEDVRDIYLRGEAMYVEMVDGTREYFDILVNVSNIPILLDFIKEFHTAKKINSLNKENMYERSFRSYAFYVLLISSIILAFTLFLTK